MAEVRGAFDDGEDTSAVPTPLTPAYDGHPLVPIVVCGAPSPATSGAIDLIGLTPFRI